MIARETLTLENVESFSCQTVMDLLQQRKKLFVQATDYDNLSDRELTWAEQDLMDFDHDHPGLLRVIEAARGQ